MRTLRTHEIVCASILLGAALSAAAQTAPAVDPALKSAIDAAAAEALAASKVPSASIAVVQNGRLVYAAAYGDAKLEPRVPATAEMRYSIGSISKQFTAAAILMLAEEGKLSLDDPVARFLPDLTRAKDVKIRQLLSHTSGYRDYWPQDYVPPFMRQPATADAILARWAKQPLDFEPGSQYQYSNTGYVAAGAIVEKASGDAAARVPREAHLRAARDEERHRRRPRPLTESDPTGYIRYGLGPLRAAPKEGPGWLFAAGELAMTPSDLAKWNCPLIERQLLKPASYAEMTRAVLLTNGVGPATGSAWTWAWSRAIRKVWHGGEVSGFVPRTSCSPTTAPRSRSSRTRTPTTSRASCRRRSASCSSRAATARPRARRARRRILEGLQKGPWTGRSSRRTGARTSRRGACATSPPASGRSARSRRSSRPASATAAG
jgi:CubicO group peptidase (beta-lactamase class C family)